MHSRSLLRGLSSTLAIVMAMSAVAVASSEARTLRVGYYIGDAHPLISPGLKSFVEEVKKETNGQIDFQLFPAGQLFKPADAQKMLTAGVADIGLVVSQYHRQEFPIGQVFSLPWATDTLTITHMYLRATTEPGPINDEWHKNGLVPLFTVTNAPYEIHSTTKPLDSLASLSGLKIRSPGGVFDEIIKSLGAVPVAVPTPETFQATQRGTVDATVYAFSNWSSMRLQEILKFTTANVKLPGPAGNTFAISRKVFDSLTPEQQAIFLKAGRNTTVRAQDAALAANERALAEYTAAGLKAQKWSDADLQTLRTRLEALREQWAKTMDAAGRPGSKVLAYMAGLKAEAERAPRDLPPPPTTFKR